jgi:two-component system sensor histidine kinase/response regulator
VALPVGCARLAREASDEVQEGLSGRRKQASTTVSIVNSLTEEERTWLREHPVIRVAQDPSWPPVEFADEQGEPSGMSNDYLKLIERRLGITFTRIRSHSWQESYARLQQWQIDMTPCVAVTSERAQFWAFTKPYMEIPIVIVAPADVTYIANMRQLAGKRIAVVEGYIAGEWIRRDFPEIQLVKVGSVKAGLDVLQRGEAFALVDNMLVTGYYMAKLELANLKIAGSTPYVNAQCMAVRKDWAILATILQKALASISEEERAEVYRRWVPIRYEHGFNYRLLWQALATFGVILAGMVAWNRKLSAEIRRREEAEAAQRKSETLLRQTQAVARVGGWEYDVETDRVTWTDETYRIHELPPDYDPGNVQTDLEFFAAEHRAHVAGAFRRAVEQGEPYSLELQLITAKGRTIWVRTIAEVERENNRVVRVFGSIFDITDRKRAEDDLRAANARLEQAVTQAEELAVRADAANRAKSQFLANMSHEIRTPMTAIMGFSELAASPDQSEEEHHEYLAAIQENGIALMDLIGNILDLSQIEAERLPLEKANCPLHEAIDGVLTTMRLLAEQKGLELVVDYAPRLPVTIHTDPLRLRQVLTNLIGNAVKFTEHGSVRIAVDCVTGPDDSARLQFAISDTGIGIPADRIGELFEPFTQLDGSATRRHGGTGLGLAISRRLANALGGNVQVASRLGEGSTFTLTIDAGSVGDASAQPPPRVSATAEEKPCSAQREAALHGRVLLAEDVAAISFVLRQLLEEMNLEVETVDDGHAACVLAQKSQADERPFNLILMDIQMPRMDGYQATVWLRQHGWQGPIVALTAHALTGDREKCLAAGCNDYLAKPITVKSLRDVLSQYLGSPTTPAGHVPAGQGLAPQAVRPFEGDIPESA